MAPNINHLPIATTIDLTGLPEPVIEEVQRIVQEARQQQAVPSNASNDARRPTPTYVSDPKPTPQEFMHLLKEMVAMGTGQSLPVDFSRADIYDDHD